MANFSAGNMISLYRGATRGTSTLEVLAVNETTYTVRDAKGVTAEKFIKAVDTFYRNVEDGK